MSKSKNIIIIVLVIIALALAGFSIYFYIDSKQKASDLSEIEEIMTIEKERVADEYEDLTYQFDGYTTTIRNDSLLQELEREKSRVKELLDELRNTRATNARRIQELRDELDSVRKIMVHLINQIDSLNVENQMLRSENTQIRQKFEESSTTVKELSKEKENLSEMVTRAAKMEVVSCELTTLTDKSRKTGLFSRIGILQFDYTIAKNVTVKPGAKTMYLRITRPDGELIRKAGQDFTFENQRIGYTVKKEYEFSGETMNDILYMKVEESLIPGTYMAEFFTDGYLVGSFNFSLKR
jgi:uncharacterized protein YukE